MAMYSNILDTSEAERRAILAHYNRTPEGIKTDIEVIKEWMKTQPNMIEIGDKRVEKFLILSKFNEEKTKEKISLYFSTRKKWPELFLEPNKLGVKLAIKQYYCYPLPKLTPDLSRVYIYQIRETDPRKINPSDYLAHWINVTDFTLDKEMNLKAVVILDLKYSSWALFRLISWNLQKQVSFIFNKIFTGRVKEVHFVNGPAWIDVILTMYKVFAPAKIIRRIHVHNRIEDLLNFIPKENLPEEYGGFVKRIEDLLEMWETALEEHSSWIEKMNDC